MSGQSTTWCHCWRLTRTDGVVLGFTDHDRALTVDGTVYEPRAGFSASEAKSSVGLAVDAADVEGALVSGRLDESEIDRGLFDGAAVETLLVDWTNGEIVRRLRQAMVATITRRDGAFHAELESRMRHLDRPNGRYLKRQCDAELGDQRCGVSLLDGVHRASGQVAASNGPNSFVADGLQAFEDRWFRQGWLTWDDGPDAGRRYRVLNHVSDMSGTVVTLADQPFAIEPGWQFTIEAGCDRHFSTCREKFSNSVNFRGFPHLPGNDAAYAYVTDGPTFDGGPLVE